MSDQAKILLVGEDGVTQHAIIMVDTEVVEDYSVVERNGRLYVWEYRIRGENTYQYRECKQPFHLE